uniref:PRKCSH domain-containing protein n=1 Tax=Trichuris muris TaxID=70415 RepID=A0A5S6QQ64_TRIMR
MLVVGIYATTFVASFLCAFGSSTFDFDELKYGIYGVTINSNPLLKREVEAEWDAAADDDGLPSAKRLRLSNKNNVEFLCSVPPIDLRQIKSQQFNVWHSMANVTSKNVTDLLEFLRSTCIRKTVGWWTYELCYGRYARQYHVEDGKIVEPFMLLGRYAFDFDWENAAEVSAKFQTTKQTLYHSQIYENGTICDLNNQFRRTEVRFYCDNDFQGAYLYSVDEPVSCQYIFNVHTSTLCQLKMLTPLESKPSPVGIECRPLLDDEQYKVFQGSSRHEKDHETSFVKKQRKAKLRSAKEQAELKQSEESDKIMKEQGRRMERAFRGKPYINVDFNLMIDSSSETGEGEGAPTAPLESADSLSRGEKMSHAMRDVTQDKTEVVDSAEVEGSVDIEAEDDELYEELLSFLNDVNQRGEQLEQDSPRFSRMDKRLHEAFKRMKRTSARGVSVKPKNPFLPDSYPESTDSSKTHVKGDGKSVGDKVDQSNDAADPKVKVKVNVAKIQTVGIPLEERGRVISETQRMEKEIQRRLAKAGVDAGSRKIKIKLLTPHPPNSEGFEMFTKEEMRRFTDVLSSLIGTSQQQMIEEQRQKNTEKNYNLNFDSILRASEAPETDNSYPSKDSSDSGSKAEKREKNPPVELVY